MASKTFKHKSFRRSYREDYVRNLEVPSMAQHIFESFRMIFKNARLFLPLLIIMVVIMAALVGLPENLNLEVEVFGALIFLVIWLVSIYLARHLLAGNKVTLREGLYNAMTPLLSSLVVLIVAVVQSVPLMLLAIAYSAAVETNFLATPFYAFLFLTFALLMILLSGYLLSGTLMALVAVSAPGLYPFEALKASNDLMAGRRMRFVIRIVILLVLLLVVWAAVLAPVMNLANGTPLVPIAVGILFCFSAMYMAVYLYLYYRWMIKYDTKEEKNEQKRRRK